MKDLKSITIVFLCVVIAFTVGAMWHPNQVAAATRTTLQLSCTSTPASSGTPNQGLPSYSPGAVVCVGDLDGSGVAKVLLVDHFADFGSGNEESGWNVSLYNLNSLKLLVGRQIIAPLN